MKTHDLYVDADHLLHNITGQPAKDGLEGDTLAAEPDMRVLKRKFKSMVADLENEIAVETVSFKFKIGKTHLVFSDPDGNFRYDLYPEYKSHRKDKPRTDAFYKLREWAVKRYIMVPNTEADDIVAYYVRKGALGASTDKDLLKGVPGRWFDAYHSRRSYQKISKAEAARFTLLQSLAGDSTDNIKGIPLVGLTTAENLLISNGASWEGVVTAYLNAGLTVDDAILTRRLIGMDQLKLKKDGTWKLTLFTPNPKEKDKKCKQKK